MPETTRILIVDDNMINRDMLVEMLAADNVEFAQAVDGEQAVELLEEASQPFDIMLLDLVMPKMDGFEVLEVIKERHLAKDMPIVMISAENAANFMSRAFDLGACDYIPRPFETSVVRRRVTSTLELFRKQRTIAAQLREANMRYMDTVKRMQTDLLVYIHMDLESDSYSESTESQGFLGTLDLDGTIDDLVTKLASHIPDASARDKAIGMFRRESILRTWEAGQDTIAFEHDYVTEDGRRLKLATAIGIMRNPVNGKLEAILYSLDMSKAYVKQRIQELLYEDVYDGIALIDKRLKTITAYEASDKTARTAFSKHYDNTFYDSSTATGADAVVSEQDRGFFLESTTLNHICAQLEEDDSYSLVVRTKDADGRKNRYTYRYLDDSHEALVLTIEDCTKSSETDTLTGRLNRSGFESAVAARLTSSDALGAGLSILFIDIRGFRTVNDLFGRESGDAILREYAKYLANCAFMPLATGRTEGDQFLCLVRSNTLDDATLREALSFTTTTSTGKTVSLRARCGIYPVESREFSVSSMCDAARAALDVIDNEYAKPYAMFDSNVHKSYLEREYLLSHLDSALENDEFEPYYQPIVDAKTHQIVSAEALVRWISPQLGAVSPAKFIPALERSGRISLVDLSIAKSVQKLLETRHASGKRIVPVSTNLSRMDFYDNDMMAALIKDTQSATIPASYLRKELTESSYVAFTQTQRQTLSKLIELGMPLLLDDFGTGASSFSTVRDVDFSIIKIDKSFIDGIGASDKGDSLLYSIVRMAHGLGLKTVAEGVEDEGQLEFLSACECDYIQGFYFSRPLPASEFERLLDMDHVDWNAL